MLLDLASGLIGAVSPVERARRGAIGAALIAAFALTGWGALVGALWFALAPVIGASLAWLAIAGLCSVAALASWGIGAGLAARARARAEAERNAVLETALAELALGALPRLLRDHPLLGLGLAAAAGAGLALRPQAAPEQD